MNLLKRVKSKTFKIWSAVGLACLTFIVGLPAFAAVDADVASTTGMVVDTMKENIIGVITANISNIVIVGVIIFSISFVYRLARRFMR